MRNIFFPTNDENFILLKWSLNELIIKLDFYNFTRSYHHCTYYIYTYIETI